MSSTPARAVLAADRRVTGPTPRVLADLVVEVGPRWQARRDAKFGDRPRRRVVEAGARHKARHERARHAHPSARIRVARGAAGHGIAHTRNWRALARHLGRRDALDETSGGRGPGVC